jgi:hypothetical protein
MPGVEKLDIKDLNKSEPSKKNKSLFAQNLERQGKLKSHFALNQVFQVESLKRNEQIKNVESHIASSQQKQPVNADQTNNEVPKKQIITGEGLGNRTDVEQIHFENLEFLSRMKPDEILAEQQKLLQQLDPKIVAFIRRKNKTLAGQSGEADQHSSTAAKNFTKEEFMEQLPFKPSKTWLNMDKIEYDKLEWMVKTPSTAVKVDANSDQGSSAKARFDFEGNVIAPDHDLPVTRALHHHGDEPDQAGYTLDELFHLARSKFNQQRVLALQTIGNGSTTNPNKKKKSANSNKKVVKPNRKKMKSVLLL